MDKFEIISVLGEGAYGIVMKCRNKANGEMVAVKKFKEAEEDESVRKTILREVKLLRALQHENIVGIRETFKRKGKLFIVFEYMEKNILELLELYPGGLPGETVRRCIFQLLKAIRNCHMNGIMHRDIKPENLLVKFPEGFLRGTPHPSMLESVRMEVKLCDFGFARMIPGAAYDSQGNRKKVEEMTVYVSTRWYRAPELLIGMGTYDASVDLWATGCIMSELLEGRPLFPGESDIDQLFLVQCCLGPMCDQHKEFFDKNPKFSGMRFPAPSASDKTLKDRLHGKLDASGLDLLSRLVRQEPWRRPTASDALRHPYFADLLAKDPQLKEELAGPSLTQVTAKPPAKAAAAAPAAHPVPKSHFSPPKALMEKTVAVSKQMDQMQLEDRKASAAPSASGRTGAAAASQKQPKSPAAPSSGPADEHAYEDDFEAPEPSSRTPQDKSSARTFVIDILPEGEDESPGLFTSRGATRSKGGQRDHSPDGLGIPSWGGDQGGVPYRAGGVPYQPRPIALNIDEIDDNDWEEVEEEDGEFDKLEAELEKAAREQQGAAQAARMGRPTGPSSHVAAGGSHRTWNVAVTLDGSDEDVEEETHYEDDYEEEPPAPVVPLQRSLTTPFPPQGPLKPSTSSAAGQALVRGMSLASTSGATNTLPMTRKR